MKTKSFLTHDDTKRMAAACVFLLLGVWVAVAGIGS